MVIVCKFRKYFLINQIFYAQNVVKEQFYAFFFKNIWLIGKKVVPLQRFSRKALFFNIAEWSSW